MQVQLVENMKSSTVSNRFFMDGFTNVSTPSMLKQQNPSVKQKKAGTGVSQMTKEQRKKNISVEPPDLSDFDYKSGNFNLKKHKGSNQFEDIIMPSYEISKQIQSQVLNNVQLQSKSGKSSSMLHNQNINYNDSYHQQTNKSGTSAGGNYINLRKDNTFEEEAFKFADMEVEKINVMGKKKKQGVLSSTNSPSKTDLLMNSAAAPKQNKLFFANVTSHLQKQIVSNPASVLRQNRESESKQQQKKIVLTKDKVAYNPPPIAITPVLQQTQKVAEIIRVKNVSQTAMIKKLNDNSSSQSTSKQTTMNKIVSSDFGPLFNA